MSKKMKSAAISNATVENFAEQLKGIVAPLATDLRPNPVCEQVTGGVVIQGTGVKHHYGDCEPVRILVTGGTPDERNYIANGVENIVRLGGCKTRLSEEAADWWDNRRPNATPSIGEMMHAAYPRLFNTPIQIDTYETFESVSMPGLGNNGLPTGNEQIAMDHVDMTADLLQDLGCSDIEITFLSETGRRYTVGSF